MKIDNKLGMIAIALSEATLDKAERLSAKKQALRVQGVMTRDEFFAPLRQYAAAKKRVREATTAYRKARGDWLKGFTPAPEAWVLEWLKARGFDISDSPAS